MTTRPFDSTLASEGATGAMDDGAMLASRVASSKAAHAMDFQTIVIVVVIVLVVLFVLGYFGRGRFPG